MERNALRANLVSSADHWRWCSLWRRRHGDAEAKAALAAWPVPQPRNWLSYVNRPLAKGELDAIRRCVQRGTPYGGERWQNKVAVRLGLQYTLRPRGRPRKVRT